MFFKLHYTKQGQEVEGEKTGVQSKTFLFFLSHFQAFVNAHEGLFRGCGGIKNERVALYHPSVACTSTSLLTLQEETK